jgi:hypothetical protein
MNRSCSCTKRSMVAAAVDNHGRSPPSWARAEMTGPSCHIPI